MVDQPISEISGYHSDLLESNIVLQLLLLDDTVTIILKLCLLVQSDHTGCMATHVAMEQAFKEQKCWNKNGNVKRTKLCRIPKTVEVSSFAGESKQSQYRKYRTYEWVTASQWKVSTHLQLFHLLRAMRLETSQISRKLHKK